MSDLPSYRTVSPVLFLVFNRPECTRRVFDRIREVRPSKLFVVADGPRADRPDDHQKCIETRRITEDIDWPCDVSYEFAAQNMGVGARVSSGISWVFQRVDRAIILEDDCLPNVSFFRFCDELLERYEHDQRISAIGGSCFQGADFQSSADYYFGRYAHIWGWATWRRTWMKHDHNLEYLQGESLEQLLAHALNNDPALVRYWFEHINLVRTRKLDTWDYQFTLSTWVQNQLAVLPRVNLVTNIGFGPEATHTTNAHDPLSNRPTEELTFPIRHPKFVIRESRCDYRTDLSVFNLQNVLPPFDTTVLSQESVNVEKLVEEKALEAVKSLQSNSVDRATTLILEAISLAPQAQNLNLILGWCHAAAGKVSESRAAMLRELAIAPQNEVARKFLESLPVP